MEEAPATSSAPAAPAPPAPPAAAAAAPPPPWAPLAALLAEGEEGEYKAAAAARDTDGVVLDRAFALVKAFIAARKLIVFGGLAIDYALRLKGGGIYPAAQRPDYDFLSPRSVDDAYDLGDALVRAGFREVSVVRAIHVQTMRVRVDFVSVADIGYAPPAVFARIPTLLAEGLRVVHPDFQRMDMHLAFCFPFNNAPLEDISHRWRKDLARFNLLDAAYPLLAGPCSAEGLCSARGGGSGPQQQQPPGETARAATAAPVAGEDPGALRLAVHGFGAYALLREALEDAAAALGVPLGEGAPPRLAFALAPDACGFAAEAPPGAWPPGGARAHVAGPDPAAAFGAGPAPARRAPFLDAAPETLRRGATELYLTRGALLAVAPVAVRGGGTALVVSPQYLLLFFLEQAFRAPTAAAAAVFRRWYAHALALLAEADRVFAAAREAAEGGDGGGGAAVAAAFAASPFAPRVTTLGDLNQSAAYLIVTGADAARVGDAPPPGLRLPADCVARLAGLPANYFPGPRNRKGRPPPFDYDAPPLFRRAGEELQSGDEKKGEA